MKIRLSIGAGQARIQLSLKAKIVLLLITTLGLSACERMKPLDLLNSVTPESEYRLLEGIAYGDEPRQLLDLYLPNDSNGAPTVVFIFGGAWREGSRQDYKFVGQALAVEGYTVVIPDYRLYPAVQYPAIIDDVRDAILNIRQRTEELGLSTDRIVLAGHSSGAHAAALLASSDRYFSNQPYIAAVIGISGPYDLPLDNPEVAEVFQDVDGTRVKPPALVDSSHPPTLLLHGEDDERVVPRHTNRYAQSLRDASVPVEVKLLDGVGHIDIIAGVSTRLQFLNATRDHILAFLSGLDK